MKLSKLVDTRVIYCGDNLDKLRKMPDGCVDLVYIDPPFNSNRSYEVFWDTNDKREKRSFEDRHASTQAYLDFMRERCVHLARVLKPNGSFYFHCDWHACHHVKVMLDQVLGENCFVNEIIWKRQSSHNDAKQGSKHLGRVHDTILLYARGDYTFNHLYQAYDEAYVEKFYRHVEPGTGRRYSLGDITAPGGASPSKGNPCYEFLGVTRYWRFSRERMQELYDQGCIVQSKPGAVPRQKRYLDEGLGRPLGSVWDDINPVHGSNRERVGYPTQKPLALLERIIQISSKPNDIVLDAFCGCGTAIQAAENLDRQWIGIDISPIACQVVSKRIQDNCKLKESEKLWLSDRGFIVRDLPWDPAKLKELPHAEFENWAIIAMKGIPNKRKVGDFGIDGRLYPVGQIKGTGVTGKQLDFTYDMWYPIQVKQKDKVGRPDIDAFETAMVRAERDRGYIVGFGFTRDAELEIRRFERQTGRKIIPMTVDELLEQQDVA